MADFKKVSLQFLRFFAANFFAVVVFMLIYYCSWKFILIPIADLPFVTDFAMKIVDYSRIFLFVWGIVPFVVSAFLVHRLHETMVFKTTRNLTRVEIFKEIIVFSFNIATIVLVVFFPVIKILFDNIESLRSLILVVFVYSFLTVVYYLINKFWVFEKAESNS